MLLPSSALLVKDLLERLRELQGSMRVRPNVNQGAHCCLFLNVGGRREKSLVPFACEKSRGAFRKPSKEEREERGRGGEGRACEIRERRGGWVEEEGLPQADLHWHEFDGPKSLTSKTVRQQFPTTMAENLIRSRLFGFQLPVKRR